MPAYEHVGDFVGDDEGAGEALVAIQSAGPSRIAGPGDGRVAGGAADVQPRQPDRHVVRPRAVPLLLLGQELAVPAVHVLQGASRVALVYLRSHDCTRLIRD